VALVVKKLVERHAVVALLVACALLYLPRAGHYGLWDPWETHYGEIARQMAIRGDVITPFWPCSPIDRPEVFHKPILHFWLMAASLALFGLERSGAPASQMIDSWRPEWALRLPNILLSIVALAVLWWAVARLRSRLAATLSALVLATSSQWLLVTRQAMTDLPFVAPMTIALACAAVALMDRDTELPAPRNARHLALAGLLVVTVPQLILFSLQLHAYVRVGARVLAMPGIAAMLPYAAVLAIAIVTLSRATTQRQLLLHVAWVMTALATLAKGPAGLALPGLTIALYLVLMGRAREILRLELVRGALLFIAVAFPWYHAMHIRHGMAFLRELIGDNYVNRAVGRSGDRGTFEYYLPWIGYGTFPWCGIIAVGAWRGLSDPRRALVGFALVWALVDLVTVTLVTTKFHHYIVPALPALAILGGLALEDFLRARLRPIELALVALPLVILCGRDLALQPARLLWLFCYDYVVAPGGRAWPSGERYSFASSILVFTVAAGIIAFMMALACRRWLRARQTIVAALALLAVAWSLWLADDFLIALSPHWSQKQVIATYYRARNNADEPLIAWNLYWRGESFYTRNQIASARDPEERTAWAYIDAPKALHRYLLRHYGRLFFLVERQNLESLRVELGPALAHTLRIVDESNNKLYLVVVDHQQREAEEP
jgi:4-amino-4-deoxy-L-arabinose transferase-like glycosyltransferase